MRMYVPCCGDTLRVTADWSFTLYGENRNSHLLESLGHFPGPDDWGHRCWPYRNHPKYDVVCPAGTVLRIERVYIRAQSKQAQTVDENYDSLTFKVVSSPDAKFVGRFWAKVSDVNCIDFERVVEGAKGPKRLTPKSIMKCLGDFVYDSRPRPACLDAKAEAELKAWWDVVWPRKRQLEKEKYGDHFKYYWRDDSEFTLGNFVIDAFGHYSRISWRCKFDRLADGTPVRTFTTTERPYVGLEFVVTSNANDTEIATVSFKRPQ